MGQDCIAGIATRYGLNGQDTESQWGGMGVGGRGGEEIFRTRPARLSGPPSLLYNRYRIIPGGKAAGVSR